MFLLFSGLTFSYSLKVIHDSLIPSQVVAHLNMMIIALLLLLCGHMSFSYLKNTYMLVLGQQIDKFLLLKVYKKLINLPYRFYHHVSISEIKILMNDALKYRYLLVDVNLNVIIQGSLLLFYVAVVFILYPKYAI